MGKVLSWSMFIILLVMIIFLLVIIIKKKKYKLFIPFIILLVFFIYSFFTTNGSVRLAIALMGHPVDAYSTSFEGSPTNYGTNNTYLAPTKDIKVSSGTMLYLECKNYGIIKISSYYGF